MAKTFYIADWHYGHANVVAFDNRPFLNVNAMNAALVERWNKVVAPEDTVYVLGDMFWCKEKEAETILAQLNGIKILIKGNHDRVHSSGFKKHFSAIKDYAEIEDEGRHVVLCHYPITCFKNHFYNWIHLYGHVHNSFEWHMTEHQKRLMRDLYDKPCEMYNVGCMMPWMDYTPRTLDEILMGANGLQQTEEKRAND